MNESAPIIIEGPEQSLVDPSLPDGGLPPAVGVQSACVFRASRDVPQLTDGRGWTYHHHVDMASWRGRLYVGWNSCQRDEDVWPSRELISTSVDGFDWSDPVEMFPQGVSTPLRMYFFLSPNGRMLVIAGMRVDQADTDENTKGGIVVREIHADHSFGEVFTLRTPPRSASRGMLFETSNDAGFVEACRSLLGDHVYLEQQDRGRLLGPEHRMQWHDPAAWPGGKVPGDNEKWVAGKAYTFFERPDGALVGISKMGWTTMSRDYGQSWSQPIVPPTLVTGKAKVFSRKIPDGRFALVYNPSTRNRFPLIVVTSDDGIHFGNMRIVQGELPIQRYGGLHRSIGPQYVRGISKWSNDGSRDSDRAMWLVYSMNKEDIWVSRVPVPIQADAVEGGWNAYRPKWSNIEVASDALRIECRDPFDDAVATRMFSDSRSVTVTFEVMLKEIPSNEMSIAIHTKFGGHIPASIDLANIDPGQWTTLTLNATSDQPMNRISFRTGLRRRMVGFNQCRLVRIYHRHHGDMRFEI